MEILDYNDMVKEIIREYDKKPENWQVLVGRSPRGFYDIIFSNPEVVWQLKLDTIYKPNPMGFGVKLDVDPSKIQIESFPPYGFRPISPQIIDMIKRQVSTREIAAVLMKSIADSPPVSTDKIKSPIAAVGPYIQRPTLEPVSQKQKELSIKIDKELEKLMRERYPWYF